MRLIDADALSEKAISAYRSYGVWGEAANVLAVPVECIENAPTIDPVRHGQWIMDTEPDDGDCRCSCCGVCIDALHRRNHETLKALGYELYTFYKYCPECGARMTAQNLDCVKEGE